MDPELPPEYDYESLRLIMEEKSGRSVSIHEATRVGNDLIELFTAFLQDDAPKSSIPDSTGKLDSNRGRRHKK